MPRPEYDRNDPSTWMDATKLVNSNPDNWEFGREAWDLPPYGSKEFFDLLAFMGLTLEEFKKKPVYRFAVARGLIQNEKWVAKKVRGRWLAPGEEPPPRIR